MPHFFPGTRVKARGRSWRVQGCVPYHDCDAVHLEATDTVTPPARTLLVPFDRVEPLPTSRSPRVVGPRRWAREVLLAIARSRPFGAVGAAAAAEIDLLPFQLEPALALRRHGRTRVLVADDVGLGKTIQAGLIVAGLHEEQRAARTMILSPAGLRDQWRQELHDRFTVAAVVADAGWLASNARQLPADINPWAMPGVYITSFDLAKRPEVLRPLEDVTWDLVIVDEVHACTRQTARRAAIHALASRARRVVLLTATPPDGDLPEMAALRSVGQLPGDPPLTEFRRTRADVQREALPRRSSLRAVRLSAAERRLHRLLERYTVLVWNEAGARADARARLAALVLRKRALSSAWSLGASVRRRLELLAGSGTTGDEPSQLLLPLLDEDLVEDAAPDAVIGAAGLADAARERTLLIRLERAAAQACGAESKIRFLLRLVRRTREPLIVFTEYRDTLQHLERACIAAGVRPVTLHGGMGPAERTEVQRAFNAGERLLLATDAASEGVNLHHGCRAVVHFELPWTLTRLRQRTGRVDRLGQTRRVHEILLVAQHTAERMVLEPLVRRAHRARQADEHADRLVDTLTEAEIGAAILEARPVCVPSEPSPLSETTTGLRIEAIGECERIDLERRVATRYGGAAVADPRLVIRPSRASARRFEVVAAVRLEDDRGHAIHTSMALLVCECSLRYPLRTHSDWCRLGRELSTALTEGQRHQPLDALHHELERAAAQYRRARAALAARAAAIVAWETSAARQLVQVGLFDRRALQARDRQQMTAALLQDDHAFPARASASSLLRTTIVALAIR